MKKIKAQRNYSECQIVIGETTEQHLEECRKSWDGMSIPEYWFWDGDENEKAEGSNLDPIL